MPDLQLLFHELIRFEIELWDAIDRRLGADHDLALTDFEAMQIIGRRTSCRVHDVAAELSITVGGTSKVVDRLEAADRCARSANPDDRRSSLIELTPTGARLLAAATVSFDDELEARFGSPISARALQEFGATLTRLRAALQDTEDQEPLAQ
jgi:DNA-binding MarR family transcriptional regulator